MIVLGIETSCDETSVAIVEKKKDKILGSLLNEQTLSQVLKHRPFGGVVPELAFREHSNSLDYLVKKTLKKSNLNISDIDAFAATVGPGLIGGLLIGSNYSKALSFATQKPFFSINHLQAHTLVSRMNKKIDFPFLCLLVSGGHTQLLVAENYKKFTLLGETLDDALGEAFDKTAKLLGLDYPGGPELEKLAMKGNGYKKYDLPLPLASKDDFNFSFSGLKTSIRRIVQNEFKECDKFDLALSFHESVSNCLAIKVQKAIKFFKKKYDEGFFVISGGVASNKFIRKKLKTLCQQENIKFYVPAPRLCVDNATMVAWSGIERFVNGDKGDSLSIHPKPRWSLAEL